MVKSNNVIRFPYLNEYQRRQIAYRRKHTSRFYSYIPSEGDFKGKRQIKHAFRTST